MSTSSDSHIFETGTRISTAKCRTRPVELHDSASLTMGAFHHLNCQHGHRKNRVIKKSVSRCHVLKHRCACHVSTHQNHPFMVESEAVCPKTRSGVSCTIIGRDTVCVCVYQGSEKGRGVLNPKGTGGASSPVTPDSTGNSDTVATEGPHWFRGGRLTVGLFTETQLISPVISAHGWRNSQVVTMPDKTSARQHLRTQM